MLATVFAEHFGIKPAYAGRPPRASRNSPDGWCRISRND
jgi:hypothetical protein